MVIAGFLLKTWMLGVGDPEVVWAETLTQTKYFTHDQNKNTEYFTHQCNAVSLDVWWISFGPWAF